MAPMATPPARSTMYESAPTRFRSMSRPGVASRMFRIGIRLCPPARMRASSPWATSWATASSVEATATYSKAGGFTPNPLCDDGDRVIRSSSARGNFFSTFARMWGEPIRPTGDGQARRQGPQYPWVTASMPGAFFGQSYKRLEDPQVLRGDALFIEDVRLVGMLHVVFVRSIHAHARFRVDASAALAAPAVTSVFTASDLDSGRGVPEIPTVVGHAALRPCRQPALARAEVRYVGEPITAVVAADRYAAEDAAAAVTVEYEPLVAVPDASAAVADGAAVLHGPLGDNIAADFTVRVGDAEAAFRLAEVVSRGRYYVHRHTGMPLETRGVVARYDAGASHLTMWMTTQWPHTVRDVLRDLLGLPEHKIRIVVPDMGGAFGVKQEIYPEELVIALLAMRLRAPVRWIETRREHLLGTAHAREQWHDVELAARRDGTILAVRAELLADMGAYTRSLGVLCPSIAAAILPGPYRFKNYTCRVLAALTSKAPAGAYRGAGQPEAV